MNRLLWSFWIVSMVSCTTHVERSEISVPSASPSQPIPLREPLPFSLTTPDNKSTTSGSTTELRWTLAEFATKYLLQVSLNPDLSAPILNPSELAGTSTAFAIPAGFLSESKTYYWNVTALNSIGSIVSNNGPFSFTVGIVAPSPVAAPAAAELSLADAMTMKEFPYGKKVPETDWQTDPNLPTINPRTQLQEVDFRSKVLIAFKKDVIRNIATRSGFGTLPEENPADSMARVHSEQFTQTFNLYEVKLSETATRLNSLAQASLLKAKKAALGPAAWEGLTIRNAQDAAERARAITDEVRFVADSTALKDVLAQLRRTSLEAIQSRQEFYARRFDPLSEQSKSASERAHTLSQHIQASPDVLDPDTLAEILNGQVTLLSILSQDMIAALKKLGHVQLRARAYLVKASAPKPLQIHLKDYDTLDPGMSLNKKPVSLDLSTEDRKLLEQRLQQYSMLAGLIKGIKDKDPVFLKQLKDWWTQTRSSIEGLSSAIEPILDMNYEQALKEAKALITASGDPQKITPEMKEAITDVNGATLVQFLKNAKALRDLSKNAAPNPTTEQTLQLLLNASNLAQAISEIATQLPVYITVLKTFMTLVTTDFLVKPGDMNLIEELTKQQAKVIKDLGFASEAAMKSFMTGLGKMSNLPEQFTAVYSILAQFAIGSFQHGIATATGTFDTAKLIPRDLNEIVDTEFSLDDIPADRGDQILLFVELVRDQEQDGPSPRPGIMSHEQHFQVERMGLNSKFGAQMIFIDRIREPGGTTPPTRFDPAPAVTWTLHYRYRDCSTLNVLDPGVGLTVATVNFEKTGPQVALGAHLSLFSDLLVAGYAFNLNEANRSPHSFFVGVGVVEVLNLAGVGTRQVIGSLSPEK